MKLASYQVGCKGFSLCDPDHIDPRGIFWVWQEPITSAEYVIGVDPSMGKAGWTRYIRGNDKATDNAAIEVFKKGNGRDPDVQVAEFAGPVDPYDLADICNAIGRLYGGSNEEGQALMCIEVYPGPGWSVQQELVQKYGYLHLPPWLVVGGLAQKQTGRFGWISNRSTRQDLWTKGLSHLNRHGAKLHSPWLVDEMADCTPDSFLSMSGRARNGLHDDRVVAMLIALWYANEWTMAIEPTDRTVLEDTNQPDYQACDISAEEMAASWEERFSQLLEE